MPVFSTSRGHGNKPWTARRRRNGVEYFLGRYKTREEAEDMEQRFEIVFPAAKGTGKRGVYAYGT